MIIRRPFQHWGLAMERRFSSSCRFTVQTVRLLLPCFNSSSVRLSTWKPIARRRKDVRDEDEDGRVRGWERAEAAMLTPRFQPERSDLTAAGKPHGCHNFSVTSARRSEGGEVWVMLQSVLAPSGSGTDISSVQRGSRGRAGGRAKTGSRLQALLEENLKLLTPVSTAVRIWSGQPEECLNFSMFSKKSRGMCYKQYVSEKMFTDSKFVVKC